MKFGREISFFASLLAMGLILNLVKYDEAKVALLRMDVPLRQDRALNDDIASRCRTLYARNETRVEKFFLERLMVPTEAAGTESCQLTIATHSTQRFFLRTQWNFRVQVVSDETGSATERSFLLELPRPLALLPLVGFLLALLFDMKFWGLGWTLVGYLFLLGGGNAIHTLNMSAKSGWLVLTTDPAFPGLLLIAFWIALFRSRKDQKPVTRDAPTQLQSISNRLVTLMVGLWNPAVYTVTGRMLFPFRGVVARLMPFLDAQFFVLCLSLYLLSVDIKNFRDLFERSLFLPRYFSFAAMLFFAVTYWNSRSRRQVLVWHLPKIWMAVASVIVIELLARRVPFIKEQPTLLRVGFALVISEIGYPLRLNQAAAAVKTFAPWGVLLFITAFIAILSQESGIKDLVMVLLEPRMHPSVIVLFTFLAGMGLGFVTGNFSASFFALFTALLRAQEEPLLRAALLDGILAGSLLSPFALYNLLPTTQFDLKLRDLIAFRFRQLGFPMLIGGAIYAVSAINSVAILQPVTFIFMCLLVVSFQLRKNSWHVDKISLDVHSAPS